MADHITTIREIADGLYHEGTANDLIAAADAVERELADLREKANPLPRVAGRCPVCQSASLFLGEGGHITCGVLECKNPTAVDDIVHGAGELADLRAENEAWKQRYRDEHEKKHSIWQKSTNEIFGLLEVMRKRTARAWRYRAERNDAERRLRESTDALRHVRDWIPESQSDAEVVDLLRAVANAALAAVEDTAATPAEERWRVGRKLGRTLYLDEQVVGMVDAADLASAIVQAMNATAVSADPRETTT